ncbi:3-methyladenine DNA glycosylase [Fictibacillus phosphorivorans]|nr:3-methyladenine DNA glycosylase [Fictibacillus phosphorivorans]MCM3718413.1 3-methyladenine DNA glycosylase [Fictibacillus phosphorivorans]MCM3776037.1 3-methyladenine DNA glycosylase [Fictibacillus phosphorivorans]
MVDKRKSEDSPEQEKKERSNEDVEPQRDPDKPDHTGNQNSNNN